jgi:N-acetyl-anhydromuramyl-L-alanine amidase AmpD
MSAIVLNRSLRLPIEQFYADATPKRQIYIHHTVGGSAESSFRHWLRDADRVGTAYLIDRDGTIFEVFDPRYWAYHLGLKHRRNTELNRASIGIEIASEGALQKDKDGILRAFDGRAIFKDKAVILEKPWRGYSYFDLYEDAQERSLYNLIKYLCEQHSVPKRCIEQKESTTFDEKFFDFNGILGHCNVRQDKTDPHPFFRYDQLQAFLDGVDLGEAVAIP